MKEGLRKYWLWIAIAIVVVVIGIVIYYEIYNAGKSNGVSSVIATIPNPSNDQAYTDAERLQIGTLTKALESMMSGFGWTIFWSDYTPITSLSQAPSRIQIGCYNQYKADRPSTDLITDINSLVSANYDFDQLRTTVIGQLNNDLQQTS